MLRDMLFERLREFFVDVSDATVDFHLGDLFDPSHFRLRDVFLKTDVINALHLPFELKAGYIGDVKVEGFIGFVAGSPLTIAVDNVCLVLGHKPVDWNHELALRYAKELLLTILQSIPAFPGGSKQSGATGASVSPAKWILNKVLATIAETTVKLERLHIRFESEDDGQPIAYGAHIPSLQFSTSDLADQVLRRREQPGVTYPADSGDHSASKRLYLANVRLYCDLHAASFLGPSMPKPPVTTPRGSMPTATTTPIAGAPALSHAERLAFMRQQCLTPFTPNAERDLVLISALWLKLDFVRGPDTKATSPFVWGLGAVDLVTEEIKVDVDFTQLAALNDELTRITDFFQREQRRAWRPACVDRERVAPLRVTVSPSMVLPVLTAEVAKQLSTDKPPRSLSRAWLRGMWRYAARCVLVAARNGDAKRVCLGGTDTLDELSLQRVADHERYAALYARSLSDEHLAIILFGRKLFPMSPRATEPQRASPQPVTSPHTEEPLTLAEQWELSDLVERLSVNEQRMLRREIVQRVRRDYASHHASPTATPTLATAPVGSGSTRSLTVDIPDAAADPASPGPVRRTSGASSSPKHLSSDPTAPGSPTDSGPLPSEFVANHHHHYSKSRADASPAGSPTKHNGLCSPSPTSTTPSSRTHPHLTHSASAPISRTKPSATGASPTAAAKTIHASFRSPPSPTNVVRQQWFIESLLPAWLLQPSRVIPLINWHIGPVSIRLHHRTPAAETAPVFPMLSTASSIPPRLPDSFMEFHLESCTGCALLSKTASVSFLVELRLGLVRASLVDLSSALSPGTSHGRMGNSIVTDYIREPTDGFLYLGIKYNFKHAARVASLLAPVEEELWDLKAKLCVGTVHIEYNDMALKSAMRADFKRRPSMSSTGTGILPIAPLQLDSASYATIVHDVLSNWKTFIERVQPVKSSPPPPGASPSHTVQQDEARKQRQHELLQARVTRLLNGLLQQSACVDVDVNGMELELAVLTSHVVERVRASAKGKATARSPVKTSTMPLPLFDSEHVHVTIPATSAGLQNRPLLNECQVHGGGARVKFRTTKQGRTAVVDYVLQRMLPPSKPEPAGVV